MNQQGKNKVKGKKTFIYNVIFLVISAGILLFLWNAPEESTARLPNDQNHARFMSMKKKAAEKFCEKCHFPEGVAPLPADHPPKYRCLFCHKKENS